MFLKLSLLIKKQKRGLYHLLTNCASRQTKLNFERLAQLEQKWDPVCLSLEEMSTKLFYTTNCTDDFHEGSLIFAQTFL